MAGKDGDTGGNSILMSVWLTTERALFFGQALPGGWLGSWVSRLLLKTVLEKPLTQVTGSWTTLLRRLQPERGYCAGDSGGDPGREHCREVSETRRFLPGPWPRVVTGCRDRGAGPRPRLPVPTPAPSGAPHRGSVVRFAPVA